MLQKIIIVSISILTFSLCEESAQFKNPNIKNIENTQFEINSLDQIIEENKGKVIYVDFWASWCLPCRKEMPNSLKLHKKYKDKVVFVYLSIDLEKGDWEKACVKESLLDLKYNLMTIGFKKSEALKGVKLESIPRYMIFDKEGKLANVDAPRPSDKNIHKEFDKYLLD
ncbi:MULTISPECIES: TlpA family protein disulfide reductase [Flavobacterium]|uniref:Thioredoxin domain-containing protein n=1 Tax=Flavobacterium hankyongi TaxID=1176532 RepID=A0ABP8ZKM1_9FLAO|nr:TlpA family protein disulfide reductase [Flavobacterium sp. N1846]